MSTGLRPWRAGLEPDCVAWWLPSLEPGSYHHKPGRAQHEASESSKTPPSMRKGQDLLSLTRTEGWRDPHPGVPQGRTAPPL